MKKAMILAAIVCAAMISQAATFKWQSKSTGSTGVLYNGTATATAYATFGDVTLYLFDAATYTHSTAFDALVEGKLDTSKAISAATASLSSASKAPAKTFDYGEAEKSYDFYFAAILDDSHFYLSSIKEDNMGLTSGTTTMTWSDLQATSQSMLDTKSYSTAGGLYETVPEPTSGLLLLLGMAGLALKRKVA